MMFFPFFLPLGGGGRAPKTQPIAVAVVFLVCIVGGVAALNLIGSSVGWYMGRFTGYIVLVAVLAVILCGSLAAWGIGQFLSDGSLLHRLASILIGLTGIGGGLFFYMVGASLVITPFPWDHDTFPQKVHARLFHEPAQGTSASG